ncbi:MAG: hypothetical protein K9H14_00005 [Actinomycetia bacterium]|nr:hypothetical protein [Actinomycetes bacterium]
MPDLRPRLEKFLGDLIKKFTLNNVDIVAAPVCKEKTEFDRAVKKLEEEGVDALLTLHLAYSPSLESIESLAKTDLPLIVFDTTPKYDFGTDTTEIALMMNHGIHGVQDLCNLLKRNNKQYFLVTGFWDKPEVFNRVIGKINSAYVAGRMRRSRVGSIGGYFEGMGDFIVDDSDIENFIGTKIIRTKPRDIVELVPRDNDMAVKKELETDLDFFELDDLTDSVHLNSIKIGLAVRKWIKINNLTGFTMNFSRITSRSGFPTIPFLEASKAMARGTGYAGEGDIITAALVGALLSLHPETTFMEMFCPDWKRETVFLSHMGEMNVNLTQNKPILTTKKIPFIDIDDPAVAWGQFKEGKATLINLSPSRKGFNLIVSPVEMLNRDSAGLGKTVTGWFKPNIPLEDFLLNFSNFGGTHHSALVYGDRIEEVKIFGEMMGFNVLMI